MAARLLCAETFPYALFAGVAHSLRPPMAAACRARMARAIKPTSIDRAPRMMPTMASVLLSLWSSISTVPTHGPAASSEAILDSAAASLVLRVVTSTRSTWEAASASDIFPSAAATLPSRDAATCPPPEGSSTSICAWRLVIDVSKAPWSFSSPASADSAILRAEVSRFTENTRAPAPAPASVEVSKVHGASPAFALTEPKAARPVSMTAWGTGSKPYSGRSPCPSSERRNWANALTSGPASPSPVRSFRMYRYENVVIGHVLAPAWFSSDTSAHDASDAGRGAEVAAPPMSASADLRKLPSLFSSSISVRPSAMPWPLSR
mmetsp:Transcript_6686/g.23241  ORF Transcript_6686/g.23241 Transcript_6686/m.23241 type:complete len:321 (+) Transcript_6686:75-1037(+)